MNILLITLSLPEVFFRLLITFANSLNPDQDRQNVGPDLDPNCLCQNGSKLCVIVFLKEFFEKVNFEQSRQPQKHEKSPSMPRVYSD